MNQSLTGTYPQLCDSEGVVGIHAQALGGYYLGLLQFRSKQKTSCPQELKSPLFYRHQRQEPVQAIYSQGEHLFSTPLMFTDLVQCKKLPHIYEVKIIV